MDTINCPRCGRLFRKIRSPVCPACEKAEEEQFQQIREFLDENPNATITECSEGTGISAKRILSYIREGRLIVPENMKGLLQCRRCGVEIDTGTYCKNCAKKMESDLSSAYTASAEQKTDESAMKQRGIRFHTESKAASARKK